MKNNNEFGRSLIEMLGVLAIIGILTVAGIAGYNYAITKYKTNTLINDLDMRSISASAQLEKKMTLIPGEELTIDADSKNTLGYSVAQFISPNNPDYFEIEVQSVPSNVCRQTLSDYPNASLIFVNDVVFKGDKSLCDKTDEPMITFVYPKALGARPPCSDKGFFDDTSYTCKCSGNTYFDAITNDCKCPAGYVWNNSDRTCVVSKCLEGEYEDSSGTCRSCEDNTAYAIQNTTAAKNVCLACGNREVENSTNVCFKKCADGEFYVTGVGCRKCDDSGGFFISLSQEQCARCPNRYSWSQHCTRNDMCKKGSQYIASTSSPTCFDCSSTNNGRIPMQLAVVEEYCNACVNKNGVKNRTYKNGYCIKTVCDSGEFMGADGNCYACKTTPNTPVNENSGCEDKACGRAVVDGICKFATCDRSLNIDSTLGCFGCDWGSLFLTTKEECERGCEKATYRRRWMGAPGDTVAYCRGQNCTKGSSFPYNGTPNNSEMLCYPCAGQGDGVGPSGTSDYAREYCEACGNYLTPRGNCYSPKSCARGSQFRGIQSLYTFCKSCDLMEPVAIEDHSEHRKICEDCTTTKRFFANNYCYRCDTVTSVTMRTSDEISSCLACGFREVVDSKCVLKKN